MQQMLKKIKSFFDKNDIHTLTRVPLLGFVIYFISLSVIEELSDKPIPESYIYIGGAVASLIASIAGIAQVYKKEVPGHLGEVLKGKWAVVSGMLIIFTFGGLGIMVLITFLMSLVFSSN